MKLQILVPRYNEPETVIKPLLDSIIIQQNVDFDELGVVICDDGSEIKLSEEFLNSYSSLNIKYISISHQGVSAARQACLDYATADYVTWADADDLYCSVCSLWQVFRQMEGDGFDLLISEFIEETRLPDGTATYISHQRDTTFVHGKFFNREWLLKENITWDKSLTVHEDSRFVSLARECCTDNPERGKYLPSPIFLWRWRSESTCRHDPEYYILETYPNMLDSNASLIRELLNRDEEKSAQFYCANMVFDAYYSMNCKDFLNEANEDYKKRVEDRFREYYKEFKGLFEKMEEKDKNMVGANVRDRKVKEGMGQEIITFRDWIKQFNNED